MDGWDGWMDGRDTLLGGISHLASPHRVVRHGQNRHLEPPCLSSSVLLLCRIRRRGGGEEGEGWGSGKRKGGEEKGKIKAKRG